MKLDELQEPLNATERYLHGINMRLNMLIDLLTVDVPVIKEIEDTKEEPKVIIASEEMEEPTNTKSYYSNLTKKDITRILDEYDVEYTNTMLKADLIDLVREKI